MFTGQIRNVKSQNTGSKFIKSHGLHFGFAWDAACADIFAASDASNKLTAERLSADFELEVEDFEDFMLMN